MKFTRRSIIAAGLVAPATAGDTEPLSHDNSAGGSQVLKPSFSYQQAQNVSVQAGVNKVTTVEWATGSGIGGAPYIRLIAAPSAKVQNSPIYMRTADRYRFDGRIDGVNGGWWMLEPRALDAINFGASGRGATAAADQSAFEAMMDAMRATYIQFHSDGKLLDYQSGTLIEPGIYDAGDISYAGNSAFRLRARVPGSVVVRIPDGVYGFVLPSRLFSVDVDGIIFVGGRGAFRHSFAASNVAGLLSFTNCEFINYTEAAITNEANDAPYLRVAGCGFSGRSSSSAIGIAWGGNCDLLSIRNCRFLQNAYHLKIGAYDKTTSGDWHVEENDFISFGGIATKADIWLVSNDTGISGGRAARIASNKFGNENYTSGSPRILIAGEDNDAGLTRATRRPVLQWNASIGTGTWEALIIENNGFSGGGTPGVGIIRSYTGDLRGFTIRGNKTTGSAYDWMTEFMGTRAALYSNQNWQVEIDKYSTFVKGFANEPVASAILDLGGALPSDSMTVSGVSTDDDASTIVVRLQSFATWTVFGGASKRAVADAYGALNGAEIVTVEDGNSNGILVRLPAMQANRKGFIQFALLPGKALPLDAVTVLIQNGVGSAIVNLRVVINPAEPTIVIPFTAPSDSAADWQFRIAPSGYHAGAANSFQVSNGLISLGRQPVKRSHLITEGTGAWDGAHLVMGAFHFWVTLSGTLRMKRGAPTSEGDGAPVGA